MCDPQCKVQNNSHVDKQENDGYVYEINNYYGVHYDGYLIDEVLNIVESDPRFSMLTDNFITCGSAKIYAGTNSDIPNEATRGAIFVDEMTIGGNEEDRPTDTFLPIKTTELLKLENKYHHAVGVIREIYELIISKFKTKKIKFTSGDIYHGWMVLNCVFEDNQSDDEPESISIIANKKQAMITNAVKSARGTIKKKQT